MDWKKIGELIKTWLAKPHFTGTIIILLLLFAGIIYAISWHKAPENNQVYIEPTQIREVVKWKIKKVMVPVEFKNIPVLNKEDVVKRIQGLPESFTTNPDEQAATTGEVKPWKGKTNVVSIINTKTGNSHLYTKQIPLPFFQFKNEGEWGGEAGYSDRGKTGAIFVKDNLVRIGAFDGYIRGEFDAYPDESESDKRFGWKCTIGFRHEF